MAFPIYIQADTADFNGPLDLRRSATPEFWAGSAVEFRIGVFEFGTIRSVGDLASVTVEIKAKTSKDEAPPPGAAPLMAKTVTSLDADTTEAEWYAYTHCHAAVAFTAEESAIVAGTHWLVVTAKTTGADPQTLTLCAGDIVVAEDGHGVVGEVPVENGQAYTKAASDARFARIAVDGALYVDASSGDDATAQHGRADLPYATLAAAFASGDDGDCVLVLPGSYAPATLSTALRVEFYPGSKLSGSLVLAGSGARLSGVMEVDSASTYSITASSSVSAGIDGSLSVNRPVAATVTLSGGVFVDKSASAFLHPGLTGNEDSLALPRVEALEVSLAAHRASTLNPHNVTKAQVGLGACDNTADLDKPLSAASQAALTLKADLEGGKVPLPQLPSSAALGAVYVLGTWSTTARLTALTPIGLTLPAGHAIVAWYASFSSSPTGSPSLFLSDAAYAPMGSPVTLAATSPANTWFGQTLRSVTTSGRCAVFTDTPLSLFVSGNYAEMPAGIKVVVLAVNIGATSW